MVKVGFIGVGGMGLNQAKSFAQVRGCKVAAASDLSPAALAKFAETFPAAKTYSNHADLLGDGDVEAVVIATPTLLHKQIAIDAMNAGRDVLSEKPLARTVADAKRMIDVAEKTGKLLMAAHCRRYDTDWGALARIICGGALGGPVLWRDCKAQWAPGSWFMDDKLGGGPILDGAIHNYDFANKMFGDPVDVVASAVQLTDVSAADTISAIVRYSSGSQLMVSWSWGAASTGSRLQDIIGPKASLCWGPGPLASPDLDTKKFGYYCVVDRKTRNRKLVKFTRRNMYVAQARHFIDCVENGATCQSPATESIKAVAVGEAILKSTRSFRPVKVKW